MPLDQLLANPLPERAVVHLACILPIG